MTESDKQQYSKWLQTADRSVVVPSDNLAKTVVAKRHFRTQVANVCVCSIVVVSTLTLAGIFTWSSSHNNDSVADNTQERIATVELDELAFDDIRDDSLSSDEFEQYLKQSREKLERLTAELSRLRERRFDQQFVLLKEQISQSGIESPKIAIIGF